MFSNRTVLALFELHIYLSMLFVRSRRVPDLLLEMVMMTIRNSGGGGGISQPKRVWHVSVLEFPNETKLHHFNRRLSSVVVIMI